MSDQQMNPDPSILARLADCQETVDECMAGTALEPGKQYMYVSRWRFMAVNEDPFATRIIVKVSGGTEETKGKTADIMWTISRDKEQTNFFVEFVKALGIEHLDMGNISPCLEAIRNVMFEADLKKKEMKGKIYYNIYGNATRRVDLPLPEGDAPF